MAVPSVITDLSTTAASNSPAGSDPIGTTLDDFLRADGAFIRQLFDIASIYSATVAGTANAITLTPAIALTAYKTGQRVAFKATGSSSGTVTVNVSGLGVKKVYSTDGTTQLTTGDLTNGKYYTFIYDSALDTAAGAFMLDGSGNFLTSVAASATYAPLASPTFTGTPTLPTGTIAVTQARGDNSTNVASTAYLLQNTAALAGSTRNGLMSVTTASATGTFTADSVVVATALNGSYQLLSSYSKAINLATTGAGGMDTGAAPVSGFVSLYAIAKPDGTASVMACNSITSTNVIYAGVNLPTGYTYSGLIGIYPTNGSSQFVAGYIFDREFFYQTGPSPLSAANGQNALTSLSISSAVPASAKACSGNLNGSTATPGASTYPAVAADGTGTGLQVGLGFLGSITNCRPSVNFRNLPIITSQTIYWRTADTTAASATLAITGYTI
jgi:hypothetical protein